MKKWLAMILLATFVFTMLSACADTKNEQANTEQEQEQEQEAEAEYRDFYEQEFWAAYLVATASNNWFWPEPTTTERERTRNISERVENTLNCKLLEEGFNNLGTSMFATKMATGDYQFSWTSTTTGSPLSAWYGAGFIQSWNDIPAVDLNNADLWGTKTKQEMATFGGEVYAATSPDDVKNGGTFGRMFYNKILAQELNPSVLPQEMYEQKNWTWASFEEYLRSVEVKEADRTVYGMTLGAHSVQAQAQFPLSAIFSNGGEIVRKDENGNAHFALTDLDAIEALDWAKYMISTGLVVPDTVFPPDIWATEGSVFILGDRSYGVASSGSSKHWGLDNLEDLRCIPFPQGPKGNDTIPGTYVSDGGGSMILYGVDKEDAGYVFTIRKIFTAEENKDTDEEWIRNTFFQDDPSDTDSYDNFALGSMNAKFDYTAQMGNQIDNFRNALYDCLTGTQTSMESMSAISAAINTELDKNMNTK